MRISLWCRFQVITPASASLSTTLCRYHLKPSAGIVSHLQSADALRASTQARFPEPLGTNGAIIMTPEYVAFFLTGIPSVSGRKTRKSLKVQDVSNAARTLHS